MQCVFVWLLVAAAAFPVPAATGCSARCALLCPLAQGWIRLTWHKNLWHFSHFCKEARPRALLRCTKFRSRSAESANVDSGNIVQQRYFWIKYSFGWNDWPRCCCFVLCRWHDRELQIWGVHLQSWEKISGRETCCSNIFVPFFSSSFEILTVSTASKHFKCISSNSSRWLLCHWSNVG